MIYDSLFPGNPRAIWSLDIEDWDAFCSPWAHDRFFIIRGFNEIFFCRKDEEKFRYTLSQCGLLTGTFIIGFPMPWKPSVAGKDPLLSSLYGLLVILTPGAEVESWLREERTLSLLRRGVRRLLYRWWKLEDILKTGDVLAGFFIWWKAQVSSQCSRRSSWGSQHNRTPYSGELSQNTLPHNTNLLSKPLLCKNNF